MALSLRWSVSHIEKMYHEVCSTRYHRESSKLSVPVAAPRTLDSSLSDLSYQCLTVDNGESPCERKA